MRRGFLFSFITLSMFAMATVAGADIRSLLDGARGEQPRLARKSAQAYSGVSSTASGSYRSPGSLRKVVIAAADLDALAEARAAGGVEISDYGSFKLFVMEQAAVEKKVRPAGSADNERNAALDPSPVIVRDDFNVLLLRSGAIDTVADEAGGSFLGLGRATKLAGNLTRRPSGERASASRLRLIQFVGPVKRAWVDELRSSGLELVAYVPNNAYLVRGNFNGGRLVSQSAPAAADFIQWEGPFLEQYKVHPHLMEAMSEPEAEVSVAVQVYGRGRESSADLEAAKKMARALIGGAYEVLDFTNVKMRVAAGRISELAALDNVINIEPWSEPRLFDERAAQIVAGDLTTDGKSARGPGYMSFLHGQGFGGRFNFAIDVSDSGIDRGFITADRLHPDFLDASGQSRVTYARDYTSEQDPGDVAGHGTINLSIAGGGNISAAAGARDSVGFNHGLGIAPFALLGSSKIFQSSGRFDLIEPYTKIVSEAYRDGARVYSNSWGDGANTYTIDSQEYDARVRDAVPDQAGNQEISISFAAGNAGRAKRVGSPGTAKNIISVAASENSRKEGIDGCGVEDVDADSALDIAFFSSRGPLDDGRVKPDIAAPGSHVQGAASQHPEFDGLGVCGEDIEKPYFPRGQTVYTWSSGTSHSTPQVAGAAALVRQFFLNRGEEPSAAIIKAMLLNTTTYMTGELAGGNLPHANQGWGLLNLNRAFDATPKVFINQTHTFGDSGQEFVLTGEVKDPTRPFRVTLAWSDAPGVSAFAPWVNDLDLELVINGEVYRGNNLTHAQSQPGGRPNTKDNVEAVWLPAGTVGSFVLRVRALNVAGDGVPGNGDSTDQDFALVVYNAERKAVPVVTRSNIALASGSDAVVEPGETASMRISLQNVSPVALTGGQGVLTTQTKGVSVTTGAVGFADIAPGQTGDSLGPFAFTVEGSVACGTSIEFVLDVSSQGSVSRVLFSVLVGKSQPVELFADEIESGEAKWTHGSLIKKKKNRVDTWTISTKRFRSGGSSWFTPNPGKVIDAQLSTLPVQLPADARNLELVFYHTFEFERGTFDGGVLEISTGGDFEDLGPKIVAGRYNGVIYEFSTNPIAGRDGWVEGRFGQFEQVVVDLSSYSGKTVVIRFRIGADADVKGLGWFVDDVSIRGERVSCPVFASPNQ